MRPLGRHESRGTSLNSGRLARGVALTDLAGALTFDVISWRRRRLDSRGTCRMIVHGPQGESGRGAFLLVVVGAIASSPRQRRASRSTGGLRRSTERVTARARPQGLWRRLVGQRGATTSTATVALGRRRFGRGRRPAAPLSARGSSGRRRRASGVGVGSVRDAQCGRAVARISPGTPSLASSSAGPPDRRRREVQRFARATPMLEARWPATTEGGGARQISAATLVQRPPIVRRRGPRRDPHLRLLTADAAELVIKARRPWRRNSAIGEAPPLICRLQPGIRSAR